MTTIAKRKSPLCFGESFTFGKFETSRNRCHKALAGSVRAFFVFVGTVLAGLPNGIWYSNKQMR
ncbi:MAG: hypothetical protein GDA42_12165 [Ekhidna sp.]|nr:hypothetical protein [Ekhidna sp.]